MLLKLIYNLSEIDSFHFLLASNYEYLKEDYKFPKKNIHSQSIYPTVGMSYNTKSGDNNFRIKLKYSKQKSLVNSINLPQTQNNVILDRVYIPNIIRNKESENISNSIMYAYTLQNNKIIGVKFLSDYFLHTKKDSYHLNKNVNQLSFNLKVFYIF